MSTTLSEQRHLDVIAASAAVLADQARQAGLDAAVPTCPAWDVRALVAHTAMVHRWAAGNLRGEPFTRTPTDIGDEADLIGYFEAGVDELLTTLETIAPDVDAAVFLKDPPATARHFWTRRQAHETTVHGADALAAALGRVPGANEGAAALSIDVDLAVDGIDELLAGFFTRGRSKLATTEPFSIAVVPTDTVSSWTVTVADERLTTTAGIGDGRGAGTTLSGTATQLYLGLWNRGEEITAAGDAKVLERWREVQRIKWT